MIITIYLDHNVWDYLFEQGVDILSELPPEKYTLAITREAEFEIPPTPDARRQYIEMALERCSIQRRPYFGLFDEQHSSSEQRVAGLDEGFMANQQQVEFIESQRHRLGLAKRPKTRLHKQEADIALAARSFDSIALTFDKKSGPLKDAYEQGGTVVFLNELQGSGKSLGSIVEFHARNDP